MQNVDVRWHSGNEESHVGRPDKQTLNANALIHALRQFHPQNAMQSLDHSGYGVFGKYVWMGKGREGKGREGVVRFGERRLTDARVVPRQTKQTAKWFEFGSGGSVQEGTGW